MYGLTVDNIHFDEVLKPIARQLDFCWWYLGGAGMTFPWLDATDRERFDREYQAASTEYANWLDTSAGIRVGKAGFFSRYARGIEGDWKIYYVSDAAELPADAFRAAAAKFDRVWFEPPPSDMPAEICLITRDVDHAYLDLFFRDEWMYQTVWQYLLGTSTKPRAFVNRMPAGKS